MSAFFVVSISIENKNDRNPYDEYIEKVKPIVENYGGKYIVRSERISNLSGGWNPDRLIIIEFETRKQLDECFSSAEYNSIKGLRESSVVL